MGKTGSTCSTNWSLVGHLHEGAPIQHVAIDTSPFRVGRQNDTHLTLSASTVSNLHAEFTLEGGCLWLTDLSSKNGTYVNGVSIREPRLIENGDLVQFAKVVFRATSVNVRASRTTLCEDPSDRAMALIHFDRLMSEKEILPFFQPVVALQTEEAIGYEVLARSRLLGLSEPRTLFKTAALFDLEAELSRMFRSEGVRLGNALPKERNLFLNTCPIELKERDMLEFSLRELRELRPTGALTLEIHEAAVSSTPQMDQLRAILSDLNIGLAYDDFGAGQTRMLELAEVPPDYLKFDLSLVQGIENASAQRHMMLETLVRMTKDLGISSVAEGVETRGDHDTCVAMGFDFGQGYLYGRPTALKGLSRERP
jgi:EAL domain-containing protein (putative c-di-GMP-specific phosphodiesterase class I)